MNNLKHYRKKIDLIDRNIVKLLLLRFKLVKQIANYKRKNKIKVTDKKREYKIINNIKKYSDKQHKKFITDIFKRLIDYSKRMQSK